MKIDISSPWHKRSFDQFIEQRLPKLLASRLPLAGYQVITDGARTCDLKITLSVNSGEVSVSCIGIPVPDENGIFEIHGKPWMVVPVASDKDLEIAEIKCGGEQLYDFIDERLGFANGDMSWDKSLAGAWLPLNKWIEAFFSTPGTAQPLDSQNWVSGRCHLRRILLPNEDGLIHQSHFGRTCPFETPEGPMIGRVLSVAVGAEIRDGKLIIKDDSPEAGLGVTSSMIPLLEHNDANRLLMGANMLRQWIVPPDPEPALVQTGNEPDTPRFWNGRNLLTAFISMGGDTFEDGIVISKSCSEKLNFPHAAEPGDKLSNRHGTKGTISRILPDHEMPSMADGTPIELVYSFIGCQSRLNFGQIRETVLGRIAMMEGRPFLAPAFHSPGEDEIRQRLSKAGLPESGMEMLTLDGRTLPRPSNVGWVYWGKTNHLAKDKMLTFLYPNDSCQLHGEMEYHLLRDMGAFENILEYFNTRSIGHKDASLLIDRAASKIIEQAKAPTPGFLALKKRLDVAGILADFNGECLSFSFSSPTGPVLRLAQPISHPWMKEQPLAELGVDEESNEYHAIIRVNDRLKRMMDNHTPTSLIQDTVKQLQDAVDAFFTKLLEKQHLKIRGRVTFSGRGVISPGPELHLDQLGLPEEMAWELFGPWVRRELKDPQVVIGQTPAAQKALDDIMARSWIILNRAPSLMPTSILGFHPVRCSDRVIRINPLVCMAMNADFDGDLAAVFLPITEAGQKEVEDKLSITAHIKRSPELFRLFCPKQEAVWGLAELSRRPGGHQVIEKLAGTIVAAPEGYVTRDTIIEALYTVKDLDGIEAAMACSEQLMKRGFEVVRGSGASINPFIGSSVVFPPAPAGDGYRTWMAHTEACGERIAARSDFDNNDIGPQLLALKTSARGNLQQLLWLLGPRGAVIDTQNRPCNIIRRGLIEGITAKEVYACVVGARRGLARVIFGYPNEVLEVYGMKTHFPPGGFNVLARAMRAEQPGVVFTSAAANGEVDPLKDADSRLFVGFRPF